MTTRFLLAGLLCLGLLNLTDNLLAEDWPRWRGPRGDGTWNAPKLPEKWAENSPKTVWKQEIGGGYAGLTVADGKLFTMDLVKPIDPEIKDGPDGTERIFCRDAATGELLWQKTYPVRYGNLGGYANGPRAAPTYDNGKLYTLGAVGHLYCLDAATGNVHWQIDTVKSFDAEVPMWGYAASPVIDGDRVIIHVGAKPGGCVMALDKADGKEIWRSVNDPAGYATPLITKTESGRQMIVWTPENIHGVDPDDGKPLWKFPYKITYGVSIATPIVYENIAFITGYWHGSKAIKLGSRPTDHELDWEDGKTLRGLMVPPLYRDSYVYSLDKDNGLTCFELKTGKILWNDDNELTPPGRNPHLAMVWLNDGDRALILNSVGELILARLTPEGLIEQDRKPVIDGGIWSHPGFSGRYMYIRTDGGQAWRKGAPYQLICIDLKPE